MKDTPSRVIAIACVLLGVWIITYWLYQPARAITRDERPTEPATIPVPVPRPAEPVAVPKADPPPMVDPVRTPPQPAPARNRRVQKLIAPEFRDYMVQKGDTTFERIASHKGVFGDGRLGSVIARANPMADPTKLKPGVTVLHIPIDPENITGKLVWVDEPIPDGAIDPVPNPTPTPAPEGKSYTIQKDDTLWKVAEQFYGKGHMWRLIADANKDVIPNPDRPKPGTVVRIPPAP